MLRPVLQALRTAGSTAAAPHTQSSTWRATRATWGRCTTCSGHPSGETNRPRDPTKEVTLRKKVSARWLHKSALAHRSGCRLASFQVPATPTGLHCVSCATPRDLFCAPPPARPTRPPPLHCATTPPSLLRPLLYYITPFIPAAPPRPSPCWTHTASPQLCHCTPLSVLPSLD